MYVTLIKDSVLIDDDESVLQAFRRTKIGRIYKAPECWNFIAKDLFPEAIEIGDL